MGVSLGVIDGDHPGLGIPVLLPALAKPVARDFLVLKYWGMIATEGKKSKPPPIPVRNP